MGADIRFEPEGLRAEIRFLPAEDKETAFGSPGEDRVSAAA